SGATVTWASSSAGVATVSAAGLVTAVGNGSASISASVGAVSGSASVTVAQEASAVVVSPVADTVPVGDTLRLVAELSDANGHAVVGEGLLTWMSSDPSVATVDESGLVSGIAAGTATVTAATADVRATAEITVADVDRAVLVAFYEATAGAGWIENDGWLSDRPVGEWHGVTTGANGRVTGLELPASDLIGSIPPELARLSHLETLNLERNTLSGSIPSELGGLRSLRTLVLGVNDLTGSIPPELGDASSLEDLRLRRNELSGAIPPELGNLTNLRRLGLNQNLFTGSIPLGFLHLQRLRFFHFADNGGLCISGSAVFAEWLGRFDVYDGPLCNEGDREVLRALYEATGGTTWTGSDGWLGEGNLDEWHGVGTDSLGRVAALDLSGNGLTGRLPASLAQLASMTSLQINGNAGLTGPLPLALSALSLQEFAYGGTDLCAPSDQAFRDWLAGISSHEGTGTECSPPSDREVLEILFDATGGTDWTNATSWLTDEPLGDWSGVTTDSDGRVVALELSGNNLSGGFPPEIADLDQLRELDLVFNRLTGPIPPRLGGVTQLTQRDIWAVELSGPIPPELGDLANLTRLHADRNQLTGPIPAELGNLAGLTYLELLGNRLTGPIPPELGSLSNLRVLYLGRDGLTGPIPPELGNLSSLSFLYIGWSDLTGPIPAELGNLSNLSFMFIGRDDLAGPIPPEQGNLTGLTTLRLEANELSGEIPSEVANLPNLRNLSMRGNRLTGPIPAELGGVTGLRWLDLGANDMTGQVPTELGGLASLQLLHLDRNRLGGSIPPELGNLAQLETLSLRENELTGSLPPELGEMAALRLLYLGNNAGLSGALPSDLTGLAALDELHLTGTGLCAPTDEGFQKWLADVGLARVRPCGVDAVSSAYLTQAVQSTAIPVPLVAGRDALLRVFVTASSATDEGIPRVRATFYRDGLETHAVDIPGSSTPIPTTLADAEGSLAMSANVTIPGSVIQPGLEFVIEVDPDGTLDPGLGVASRIPETGRASVQVEAVPVLDLTVVPFLRAQDADSSIVEIARSMAADPDTDEMLADTRAMLPVHGLDVKAHEPILTSTTNVSRLIGETGLARRMEGGTGYYMGIMPERVVGGQSGIASLGGRVGFSVADPFVIAHELGHNLSLLHAPCGGAGGPDRAFPQENGSIGVWGYDARGGGALVAPHVRDVMSYCGPPRWISDFSFARALSHRVAREAGATAFAAGRLAAPRRTLVLWGGVDEQGSPFLEPSFVADALPSVPRAPGDYRLVGLTASGDELFSLSFDMEELADVDGWSFAFALPARDDWAGALESITLSGPEGTTTMDRTTDRPMAIVRDPDSGRLRGVLRGADALQARAIAGGLLEAADATGVAAELSGMAGSLEVLFSRGVPAAVERRR
ncbi:MAG: hypothetical protein F4059_07635, partial [Gemmatimonadetes bacterium]|nr:hypothetical protein [Gemmatimonadota bacterium]